MFEAQIGKYSIEALAVFIRRLEYTDDLRSRES
jgi:hypothetical protein